RERDYWVDSAHTVAVTLDASSRGPTIDDLANAIREPERPLFIGRKTCLPATRMYRGRIEADTLSGALQRAPLPDRADDGPDYRAWWPCEPGGDPEADMAKPVTDRRDWENQIHVGERWIAEGTITVEPTEVNR
ncbi:MAG: type I-E CRISPR-associated protein Cas5/CasD, partial [Bradymonadaceae bacterium]